MTLYADWDDAGIALDGKAGEVDVLCPECSHKRSTAAHRRHKCLSVNTDKQTWRCHNCGWTGGLEQTDWRSKAKLPAKFTKPEPVDDPSLPKWVVTWFKRRGIDVPVLERNRVYAGDWYGAKAIAFPFLRDGEIVIVKYRLEPKDFRVTKDAEKIPFGLDDVKGAECVYLVEGEIDKLTVEQVTGNIAVLSPPNGSAPSDDVIAQIADAVLPADKVVLAGDMTDDGQAFMERLARRIGYDRCWRVTWPEKDANDTLMAHGADAVRECLEHAKPYPVDGIVSVSDLRDLALDLYDRGMPPGMSTGWPSMDTYWTVAPSELTILTGVPGSGKTRWLDHLMHNLREQGTRVGMCSMETVPLQRHVARLAQLYTGKSARFGNSDRMSRDEFRNAVDAIDGQYWFVHPQSPSVDAVLEAASVLVRRNGVEVLVIDPYNRLDHARPSGVSETEFCHQALSRMQRWAQNHSAHVLLVAHPTKLHPKDDGEYPVATPYDITGSAGFFNIADNCLSVWRSREDMSKPVVLHVQKIRNEENGKLGKARFHFDIATGRYTEVESKVVQFGGRPSVPFPVMEDARYGNAD